MNHDIQLLTGSTMIPGVGGVGGIGELDRAPGAPTPMMHIMGASADLEDPPGLFEKVCVCVVEGVWVCVPMYVSVEGGPHSKFCWEILHTP